MTQILATGQRLKDLSLSNRANWPQVVFGIATGAETWKCLVLEHGYTQRGTSYQHPASTFGTPHRRAMWPCARDLSKSTRPSV